MHSAALLVTAYECAETAATYGGQQYMLGVRDALEAVFRACYNEVQDDEDAYAAARQMLDGLTQKERVDLLTRAQTIIYARRRESVEMLASFTG